MKAKGIIYSPEMIRAIIAGRKHKTRRIMNPQPTQGGIFKYGLDHKYPWLPGDILYARENFKVQEIGRNYQIATFDEKEQRWKEGDGWHNRVCIDFPASEPGPTNGFRKWFDLRDDQMTPALTRKENKAGRAITRPSIHLPLVCARIWQRVEAVRFERLQDISEADAIAEGMRKVWPPCGPDPVDQFKSLWKRIHEGPKSWDTNPWVWVLTLDLLTTEGPPCLDIKGNLVAVRVNKTESTSKI